MSFIKTGDNQEGKITNIIEPSKLTDEQKETVKKAKSELDKLNEPKTEKSN